MVTALCLHKQFQFSLYIDHVFYAGMPIFRGTAEIRIFYTEILTSEIRLNPSGISVALYVTHRLATKCSSVFLWLPLGIPVYGTFWHFKRACSEILSTCSHFLVHLQSLAKC